MTSGIIEGRVVIEDLTGRLRAIENGVNQIGASVAKTARLQEELQRDLRSLRRQLLDYIDEDRSRQSAQAALLDARAQLDREFGPYQVVRRNATGMLRALDTGIVTHATLQEAAERLMLDAPSYWLVPALVALVAWIRDSPAVAECAALEATRRDLGKAALFFSLMAARYARHGTAGQWLYEYLCSLDCRSLTADFAAIMDAAARGDLGGPARDRLIAVCTGWREQLKKDSQLVGRQVERWGAFIESQRQRLGGEFDLLPEMSADSGWNEKLDQLEANAVFRPMKNWLHGQLAPASPRNEDPATSIDALLRSLVEEHDNREAYLLGLIDERQAVIGNPGNRARTTTKSPDGKLTSEPKRDFLTLLTDVASSTPGETPPARVPLFALTFSGAFIKEAMRRLRERNERSKPVSIEVAIDGWVHAVLPSDDAEELALEYSEFTRSEMLRPESASRSVTRPGKCR